MIGIEIPFQGAIKSNMAVNNIKNSEAVKPTSLYASIADKIEERKVASQKKPTPAEGTLCCRLLVLT